MPQVSVVVPTRNRSGLLRRAVRSVLGQRDVDLEVVVVDDGSTDQTAEAVASLEDRRVRRIRHDRPKGVATARNAGAAAASGAWVALLDDDDLWAPDKLARQLAAAGAVKGWVYAGAVEVDMDDRLLGGVPPPQPEELVATLTRRNLMPAGCSNVIVHAELLADAGGFDPALRHLADWDLWLRLTRLRPPACVPLPLVAYRLHPGQATLDVSGMVAEAHVLRARHGVRPAAVHRWAAWSHLRAGDRLAATGSYAGAVACGDIASLARIAMALLHPRPTSAGGLRRPRTDPHWLASAQTWLDQLGRWELEVDQ